MFLCRHVALDEVRPENRLLYFYTGQGYERGAEREHRVGALLVVENHTMRCQVDPARLLALEFWSILVVKVQSDIVTEQQDAETKKEDREPSRKVLSINHIYLSPA